VGRLQRIVEAAERVTGVALRPLEDVTQLEETAVEYRGKMRELQDLAYTVLDYVSGAPEEMKAQERRRLAQKARVVWQQDPQYGGTVNLLNEFVLGRGVPKPQANDEQVQSEIDEFWEDHDNQRVLTTHQAQVRLNTDLTLQSNIFPLVYDGGDDGKVKLGYLAHDWVEEAVRDDDSRLRILYYLTKSHKRKWDPKKHTYVVSRERNVIRYYEEFCNLQDAQEEVEQGAKRDEPLPDIPAALIGKGRVVHVAVNRTMEQAFGIPEIARTIRWLTAYNDLMRARVDMAKAAASIIMRRKLKGSSAQAVANKALLASGGSAAVPDELAQAPRPGSILEDFEGAVEHESFNLNSGSQGAMQDAQMIRSQVSGGTGWPGSYLGDPTAVGLSNATQLELRVLKMVESRQQVLEDLIRLLIDHKIQRAIDTGRLSKWRPMTVEERQREAKKLADEEEASQGLPELPVDVDVLATVSTREEEEEPPEGMIERDLSYQVSMPSPLRRSMTDLVSAGANIAKTFDPNNTNLELSKLLLGILLGEGLEVEDPGAAVERIFPDGYVDPAMAAAAAPPEGAEELEAPIGADGQRHPNPDNPYGAPQRARPAEEVMQQAEVASDLRVLRLHSRTGEPVPQQVQEAIVRRHRGRELLRSSEERAGSRERAAADRGGAAVARADELLEPALAEALALVA
jgi:hypothetical protein